MEAMIIFFQDSIMKFNRKSFTGILNRNLCINFFTVTFAQFNASLLREKKNILNV